jgi:hypothetical protein
MIRNLIKDIGPLSKERGLGSFRLGHILNPALLLLLLTILPYATVLHAVLEPALAIVRVVDRAVRAVGVAIACLACRGSVIRLF